MNQLMPITDWRSLAEEASNEMDSTKLTGLVSQLCLALEEEDEKRAGSRSAALKATFTLT